MNRYSAVAVRPRLDPDSRAQVEFQPEMRPWRHLVWFVVGAAIAFAVPYLFTSVLDLNHDLYYLIFFAITLAFLSAYASATQIDLGDLFRRNWRWSFAVGIAAAAFVSANVLSRDSTPGPSGAYAVFEVFWRGGTYGVVDALLLTAFPGVVALGLLRNNLEGLWRKIVYVLAALPLVLIITGTYHLGYKQFREDGIGPPEFGNTVISTPMFATANPIGSIFAHASMHVAADIHSYETDIFLPPQTDAP